MAGSSVIGALRVALGLDSAQFTRGANDAEKRACELGRNIGKALRSPIDAATSLKGAIGGLAGALALKELAGATQRAFDYADAIQDLSDRSGASTKAIQEFRFAAQLSGSSVEVADAATEKFARTLGLAQQGSDAQVKLFRSLGVTSTDFDTALRQTLDGIAKLPTVQQRAAVGFQIFGKSSATLTGLLGQGSAGFDELATRAKELGIVLGDDIIRNAGGANDKLDTLKMILNAQFASAVTQNANSIVALADGITTLTGAVLKFLNSNPQAALAIIGGIAGSRAGPVGAAVGAIGGYALGTKLGENASDGNMDLKYRRQQFRAAIADRKALQKAQSSGGLFSLRQAAGSGDGSAQEVVRQGQLYQDAIVAAQRAKTAGGAGGALPTVGTGEAATAAKQAAAEAKRREAERKRAAAKALEDERRYQHDLGRSRDEQLNAQLDLTADQNERVNIQTALLDNEHRARVEEIQTDKDLTAAQKAQLIALEDGTHLLRARLLHQQDQEELARQALDNERAANDNRQDVLTATAALARTSKERGRIELQILDLQFDQLKAEQQNALDNAQRRGDVNGVQQAQQRLGTLDTLQSLARAKSQRDNAGPLQQYFDSIPRGADEMNEALQRVEADGLGMLIDGLSNVEGGFKSLASTVSNVSNQIISSLLKIGLQKGIAALFGAIFPQSSGGLSGGIFNSPGLTSSIGIGSVDAIKLPGRAKGGSVIGGRAYIVGEEGPEPFIPSRSGTIIPHDMMMAGGNTVHQTIQFTGAVDIADRKFVVQVAEAARQAAISGVREEGRRRA
jgi:hypothetical protein